MDLDMLLAIAGVIIALLLVLRALYKRVMADGVVTLEEVFEAAGDAAEAIKEAKDEIEDIQGK